MGFPLPARFNAKPTDLGEGGRWWTLRFLLDDEQYEVVDDALRIVLENDAASPNSKNPRGSALAALAAEYLAAHTKGEKRERMR